MKLSDEDMEIVSALEQIKVDISSVQNTLNQVTDPVLIDSYVLEENALNLRYGYYLNLYRNKDMKDITANGFSENTAF